MAEHDSSSPPRGATIDGFLLGAWVDSRRTDYRRGRLPAERIARLESEFPGWRWNVLDAAFAAGVTHLHRYRAVHGASNPRQRDVIDGFPIGQWAANRRADYRAGRLPGDRIMLIENEFADWQWNPQAAASVAAFEAGLAHLRRYRAVHGTSNPRQRDVIDGFPIGQWAANRRADYRKGRLAAERIRRIETKFPDWRWTIRNRS
ncbi:UNVERIFIED_ORG: helicase associated protein [Gordonia westfalica J30]